METIAKMIQLGYVNQVQIVSRQSTDRRFGEYLSWTTVKDMIDKGKTVLLLKISTQARRLKCWQPMVVFILMLNRLQPKMPILLRRFGWGLQLGETSCTCTLQWTCHCRITKWYASCRYGQYA